MELLRRIRFDLRYLFKPPWDTGVSPPELLEYIANHPARRALDMGCGTGTNVLTLAEYGWSVTGIDFSARAVRIARRKLSVAGRSASLLVADVTRPIRLEAPFDLVLDIGCFHSVPDRNGYLRNLSGLLRPGGHWLMYGFLKTPDTPFGLSQHDLHLIQERGLRLKERRDGVDGRERASAWFLFQGRAAT